MNKQKTSLEVVKPRAGRKVQKRAPSNGGAASVSFEERHNLISTAAYYLAERRGFFPGAELNDWLEAETQIDSLLNNTEVIRHS
jgi:hypothetical protein